MFLRARGVLYNQVYSRRQKARRTTHEYAGDASDVPVGEGTGRSFSLRSSSGASPPPSEVESPVGKADTGTESGVDGAAEPRLEEIPLKPESVTLSRSVPPYGVGVLQRVNTWFTICVRPP